MRKMVPFSFDVLNPLLALKTSKRVCALFLKCSEDTIERRIRAEHNMSYKEYADLQLIDTGNKLAQKAIQMALDGHPTLLIFCLKNINKWTDRPIVDEIKFEELSLEELKSITAKANQYIQEREAA